MTNTENGHSWDVPARAYLARLGEAEYQAFLKGRKRKSERYSPSPYHRELIDLLNAGDENGFKAEKMLRGYASAVGV